MKCIVVTFGTEGDARPLAALAHALARAGHEVSLLGDARTLGAAHALGISASPLSGDIRGLFAEWGRKGPRSTARALVALVNAQAATWMREVRVAAEGADAIVSSGLASFVGLAVAERLGVPAVGAGLFPLTPTREFPTPMLPPAWVPAWSNRGSSVLVNELLWLSFRKALDRARTGVLGLPPRRALPAGHAMLYGISPTLLPQRADWPANAVMCGQWDMPPAPGYAPPAALAEFLAGGAPPVYIGFGSMTGIDMPAMLTALVAALDGRRAVFWPGWNGMGNARLPDHVLRIDATPHAWLFPRVAAVLHHGGSGTTHSASRAGRPSIILPFAGDQPFWADRLHRLGIAPPALGSRRPDVRRLAAAFRFTERTAVVTRAAEIGRRMAREDGLAAAVAAFGRLAAR